MMRRLFDFKCPDGHVKEHLVGDDTDTAVCGCGKLSRKIISPVRFKLDAASGHFPTATDKWIRQHEREAKISSD